MAERQIINPWTWQDSRGFVQANEVRGAERTVYCAGVISVDENGQQLHEGNMRAQAMMALDNLETILGQADLTLADVVRLTIYTTDMDGYLSAAPVVRARLAASGCRPASTLLGVARLAMPTLLIELEATAVQ
jgi:enamine deaminase RidA (YjgF/YER057c/UK114 family)